MSTNRFIGTIPEGTVYGVVLNDQRTLDRLKSQFDQDPYKAPPVAPILYIKSRNTMAHDGAVVMIPVDPGKVRIDATVGAVIGKQASRITPEEALEYVAGYVIVSDITLPHEDYYRPVVPLRCRDGFCPMSKTVAATQFDPSISELKIFADNELLYQGDFSHRVRDLPQLLCDVTEFMTLEPGDVLMLGLPEGAPIVGKASNVKIEVTGLGALSHSVDIEGGEIA